MRFVAYDDHVYERDGQSLRTDRTFPLFMAEVGRSLDGLVLLGRMRPEPAGAGFQLPDDVRFEPLPHYDALSKPWKMAAGATRAARAFWRALDDADGAWVLGPHPLGLVFAVLTLLRRRRLVLGVRQELPVYARRRHPTRRLMHLIADGLERAWRTLARFTAVAVVGPELRRQYSAARRLHEMHVSMMRLADIVGAEALDRRDYDGALTVLSVGRLDEEKNPLLLADILAGLRAGGREWRLVVCGAGSLEEDLARRLAALGVDGSARLDGYVPLSDGLRDRYRSAHAFLHVSWTEGVPQVLFEAFAERLPVVATDVGGVGEITADGEALLIPPGDAMAACAALEQVAADESLRRRLTTAGARQASRHSLEHEAAAVARFLAA